MASIGGGRVEPERSEDLPRGAPGQAVERVRQALAVDPVPVRDDGERGAHRVRVHERVVEIEDDVARLHDLS